MTKRKIYIFNPLIIKLLLIDQIINKYLRQLKI